MRFSQGERLCQGDTGEPRRESEKRVPRGIENYTFKLALVFSINFVIRNIKKTDFLFILYIASSLWGLQNFISFVFTLTLLSLLILVISSFYTFVVMAFVDGQIVINKQPT